MWVGTRQTVGVARGFGEGVAGAVGGVVELAGAVGSCVDPVTRIIDRGAQDRCTEFVGGLVDLGAAFVENPKETTYYLFLEPIYTDWQAGNYGEAIGGSLFVAVEVVVGAKGAASGAKAATAAIRSTRIAQSAGQTIKATAARVRTGFLKGPADEAATLARYDADFALGQLTLDGQATASELAQFGLSQGWKPVQTLNGPLQFVDDAGVIRLTIKSGSARTPGSGLPHVEIRNAARQRVSPLGNPVSRRSPLNHTPIIWDLE